MVAAMKQLLFTMFVMGGFGLAVSESVIFAEGSCGWVFGVGTLSILVPMMVVGCTDFSDATTNRLGWLFMLAMSVFSLYSSISHHDGFGRPMFALAYVVTSVLGLLSVRASASHGHQSPAH